MLKENKIIYLGFALFAIIYTTLLFLRIPEEHFLFISDQVFRFNQHETFINAFYMRKLENFGVFNAWQLVVQTPEILYYSIIYKLGLNLIQAEQVLFSLIIFISLSFSYYSFQKLSEIYIKRSNWKLILPIAIWYVLNPYTMVLWHGAIYNFGSSLTYSLAPLIVYYFHKSLLYKENQKDIAICALLLFAASFTFWMLAALGILLLFYLLAIWGKNPHKWKSILINLIKLISIYIPLTLVIIFPIFYEFMNNSQDVNGTFAATFGSLKGGMFYQFFMWFSWGIYNTWTPRSIYPENITTFYKSAAYLIPTLLLYTYISYLIYIQITKFKSKRKFFKKEYLLTTFLIVFVTSIFFAKGDQAPLGGIFLFLYENVPFFKVFRSSDHRFGFPAVLSLSLILLLTAKWVKSKNTFFYTIIAVIVFQNFVFFTGDILIGQNKNNEYIDRIVSIPNDYKELANFINSQKGTFYIYPNASIEFGTFNLTENETHIGQDILPKLIEKPFTYLPVTSGMYIPSGQILYAIASQDKPGAMSVFPVKYILMRKDTVCDQCPSFSYKKLNEETTLIFANKTFELYEIQNFSPLINSNAQIKYKMITPTLYEVEILNLKNESGLINFMQSHNNDWQAYVIPYEPLTCQNTVPINANTTECTQEKNPLLSFHNLNSKHGVTLERTQIEGLPHINTWSIEKDAIISKDKNLYRLNDDNSINLKLRIYYKPQAKYMTSMLISLISLIFVIGFILTPFDKIKKIFSKKNG